MSPGHQSAGGGIGGIVKISIIAAIDASGAISKWNEFPWRQDAHVARMQGLTRGHHVIMSRNAYRILPRLDDAKTIVLSNGKAFPATLPADVTHHRSIFTAIEAARSAGETEVFLVGGFEVFAMGLLVATDLHITRVNTTTRDEERHNAIRFPELASNEWHTLESRGPIPADERNQYSYGYEHRQRYGDGVPRPHQQQVFPMLEMCCSNCLKNFTRRLAYVTMCKKRGQNDFFCSHTCRAAQYHRERRITSRNKVTMEVSQ